MSDKRRDGFGLPYKPPDAETAVAQYLNRSMHNLHVAEYRRREFERLEDRLNPFLVRLRADRA